MKLLFREDGFSKEFRELLGFIDNDIKYTAMRPDLTTASKEVYKLIGEDAYGKFETLFDKCHKMTDEETIELRLIQYPIALRAYNLSAPVKDVQHTQNGRLMRRDEHNVAAMEWMLKRSDEATERKYYKALDILLDHLFEDDDFKSSDNYKKLKKLFLSATEEFEEYYPLESRLLLLKLQPGIRQAQKLQIKPRLGTELYNTITEEHLAGTITTENEVLYALIQEACVYWSLQWAMHRLTVNLLPEGLLQEYASDRETVRSRKTPEALQTQLASQKFREDAHRIFLEIEKLVAARTQDTTTTSVQEDTITATFTEDDGFVTT